MTKPAAETAAKITTRKASKHIQDMAPLAKQLKSKHDRLLKLINKAIEQTADDATRQAWSKGNIIERQYQFNQWLSQLEAIQIEAISDLDLDSQIDFAEDDDFNEKAVVTKAKLRDRLDELTKTDTVHVKAAPTEKFQIELQQTDATGNISNVWG